MSNNAKELTDWTILVPGDRVEFSTGILLVTEVMPEGVRLNMGKLSLIYMPYQLQGCKFYRAGEESDERVIYSDAFYGFLADRWMFLTGDADRLTHGATYIRLDDDTLEYKKISNLREALGESAEHEYQVEEGFLWVSDLEDDDYIKDALTHADLNNYADEELGIFDKMQACISDNCGIENTAFGDDATLLLGFDPEILETVKLYRVAENQTSEGN